MDELKQLIEDLNNEKRNLGDPPELVKFCTIAEFEKWKLLMDEYQKKRQRVNVIVECISGILGNAPMYTVVEVYGTYFTRMMTTWMESNESVIQQHKDKRGEV